MDEIGGACERSFYSYEPLCGLGHFIHTYDGDGNPIPPFSGSPERVYIPDDIDEFTGDIWNSLHADNKVSLYVRYIDLERCTAESRMQNKNQ